MFSVVLNLIRLFLQPLNFINLSYFFLLNDLKILFFTIFLIFIINTITFFHNLILLHIINFLPLQLIIDDILHFISLLIYFNQLNQQFMRQYGDHFLQNQLLLFFKVAFITCLFLWFVDIFFLY